MAIDPPRGSDEGWKRLGYHLAQRRKAAGHTQETLAVEITYSRSTVANVECGRQRIGRDFWSRCDEALRADGVLSAEHDRICNETNQRRIRAIDQSSREKLDPINAVLLLPGSYVPFQVAALDKSAADWLRTSSSPHITPANSNAARVQAMDVQEAARQLRALREVDHQLGAGSASRLVSGFLSGMLGSLTAGDIDDPAVQSELCRVAGSARELAGYQAVDSGADGVAQRHYLHALSLAGTAGDKTLGAFLLGVSLGHLSLHCGYPDRGLRLAQTALTGSPPRMPAVVHAALWAVVARAHARLGDELACTSALRTAETHLDHADGSERPEWITYLTPAYLADEVAHCMFDLGHYDAAQREVEQAINGIGPDNIRRIAIDTALLASSLASTGQLEEACARGRDAVDLAARTKSMRAVQRVTQVGADLIPYEGTRQVAEFSEYVRAKLPSAIG